MAVVQRDSLQQRAAQSASRLGRLKLERGYVEAVARVLGDESQHAALLRDRLGGLQLVEGADVEEVALVQAERGVTLHGRLEQLDGLAQSAQVEEADRHVVDELHIDLG